MIYEDFESILVPEDNEKENPDESYRNKYQKHVVCSYGYKFVCVDYVFYVFVLIKTFMSYLGQNAAYNFINS